MSFHSGSVSLRSRQRILRLRDPESTGTQGGGGGGCPVAVASTDFSFGPALSLGEGSGVPGCSYLVLRFLHLAWLPVTWGTGPIGTSTPSSLWWSTRRGPLATTSQWVEEHHLAWTLPHPGTTLLVAQLQ